MMTLQIKPSNHDESVSYQQPGRDKGYIRPRIGIPNGYPGLGYLLVLLKALVACDWQRGDLDII